MNKYALSAPAVCFAVLAFGATVPALLHRQLPAASQDGSPGVAPVRLVRAAGTVGSVATGTVANVTHIAKTAKPRGAKAAGHSARSATVRKIGQATLAFEANAGLTAEPVKYLSRGDGYNLFLTPTEAVFALEKKEPKTKTAKAGSVNGTVLRMKLLGANTAPRVNGQDVLPGKVNYFLGKDKSKWRTNVPTYGKVKYDKVYPGVDLVYYGNQRQLEYDFVVAPGADPNKIKLAFSGADKVAVEENGGLTLHAGGEAGGEVHWKKPYVYQEIDGKRQEVESSYEVNEADGGSHQVSFRLAAYDAQKPLVIDPVLVYSTYLGGTGTEAATDIALDPTGNAYVTGSVDSGFPTSAGAFQTTAGGNGDAFVAKIDASGATFAYKTYLGGGGGDAGTGIAVDINGNAYICGNTISTDFPASLTAFQTGQQGRGDAFVTKLNAAGDNFTYSTYLGGGVGDSANDIGIDTSGNAYVTGFTQSTNFPLDATPIQGTYEGNVDGFATKINTTGSGIVYSTYLGGTDQDSGVAIAVDTSGNAYVAGSTISTDFPLTPGVFQTTPGGDNDVFVVLINGNGTAKSYSTLIGGNDGDDPTDIAIDTAGNAYITGNTTATNYPTTTGAYKTAPIGNRDAFVTKLNTSGTALVYSTYLGGTGDEDGGGIAVDSSGNAYVSGTTASFNFPSYKAVRPFSFGVTDGFVTNLNSTGTALIYSTNYGGSSTDSFTALALDSAKNAIAVGTSASADYPVQNAAQSTSGGGDDTVIASISPAIAPIVVNDSGDAADLDTTDGSCDSNATSTGFQCTLRAAIETANANAGADSIQFAIGRGALQTISPASGLPAITEAVTIDGYTESGATANTQVNSDDAVLRIEINGSFAGAGANGLSLTVGASGSTISGLIINRFTGYGIQLDNSSNNIIAGNYIGTDPTGLIDQGNTSIGVGNIFGTACNNNLIGGITPAARNIIAGNGAAGINFSFSSGNTVRGNFVGLGADGTTDLGNDGNGVEFNSFVSGITIGGDDDDDGTADGVVNARNIISGNANSGIFAGGAGFGGATIRGNYIGTDATGSTAVPNQAGIGTNLSGNLVVGGTTSGARNVISGNNTVGITIGNTTGADVRGNYVGVGANGSTLVGNGTDGIYFLAGSSDAVIGGVAVGEANTIAGNGRDGVRIDSGTNNVVRGNSIFANDANGIDLGGNGPSANDTGDADTGANNVQNFPVITGITSGATSVIRGTLNSTASTSFNVDIYSNVATTLSGFGQGQTYLGGTTVTTDAGGNASFNTSFATNVAGRYISATATPTVTPFNTSEFAAAVLAGQNFVVDTTSDAVLSTCSAVAGDCSLRGAITAANANANPGATDAISFAIPTSDPNFAAGVYTISPATALPAITQLATIDGSTQTGYTTTPVIQINGSGAGASVDGLTVSANGVVIRALCINRFATGAGLNLTAGAGLGQGTVESCFLGTNPAGTAAQANSVGIFVSSDSNTIGGLAATRNIISGNSNTGLLIRNSDANNVFANYIGVGANGSTDLGNALSGVLLDGGSLSNNIGFITADRGNVISGNAGGVRIEGTTTTGNKLGANFIGLAADGSTIVPNDSDGVQVVSANGNFIGQGGAGGNTISGNGGAGVSINGSTTGNTVQLNIIGLDSGKTLDKGNTTDGVTISNSSNVSVSGNTLSGNGGNGVQITTFGGGSATGNSITSNSIGTTNLRAVLGNTGNGILIDGTASGNFTGGTGVGNSIANNGAAGIQLTTTGNGNHFSQNAIYDNGTLGIDLGTIGVTANDAKDPDTGANDLQNFPVITSVVNGTNSVVNGTINSTVGTQFTIEVFANTAKDSSGNGEGETYLGSVTTAAADANGDATFTFTATGIDLTGRFVSASATPTVAPFSTSEFSATFGGPATYEVDTIDDTNLTACTAAANDCSLRGAINNANANAGADTINFNIPGGGVQTLTPASALPTITEAVTIDGYTQPGASANSLAAGSNAVLQIEIDGTNAGAAAGLTISSANSIIRGLVINRFPFVGAVPAPTGLGISITGGSATSNTVEGCYLGTNAAGTAALQNIAAGVIIQNGAHDNLIGGTTPAARNVISGNLQNGVRMAGSATGNFVYGNYIGLNAAGTAAVRNGNAGVSLLTGSNANFIGGILAGQGNVISGNQNGVSMDGTTTAVSGNFVRGNLIGTNPAGTAILANNGSGVVMIAGANGNTVGGNTAAASNVISGANGGAGVGIVGSASNTIQGNYIGTTSANADLGNSNSGVFISGGGATNSTNNVIGGTGLARNVIAYNNGDGVEVQGTLSTGNSIRGNNIYDNSGSGIDLAGDGLTANDALDADTGFNNLQNFPVITNVTNGTNSVIVGTLNSTVGDSFTIDLFSNTTADASGFGEGETYLGSTTTAATNASGDTTFTFTATGVNLTGKAVTATATRNATPLDTSEFSAAVGGAAIYEVDTTSDSAALNACTTAVNDCSLRGAINNANANPGADTINFEIPGAGGPPVRTISPASALPPITGPVTIDGYTQSGSAVRTTGAPATLLVELDGSGAPLNGLSITGGGTTVKGLIINGFTGGAGISTLGGNGNRFYGNFIGTNSDGSAADPNQVGISIAGTDNDQIGSTTLADRNIIAGNSAAGIEITGAADGTTVANNYIGIAADGASGIGNGTLGNGVILRSAATNVIIGGSVAAARNIISGNEGAGVLVENGATGNGIRANYIGTNDTGSLPCANGVGVDLQGAGNFVGGTNPLQRNVISGNTTGVYMQSATATGNTVEGNYIGTDATGNAALPVSAGLSGNTTSGVSIGNGASTNTVGGTTSASRNIISGNGGNVGGIFIFGTGTSGNKIYGNYIGTDTTGAVAVPNSFAGGVVIVDDASGNFVGGAGALGNTISGNDASGVSFKINNPGATPAHGNFVQGNRIGTNAAGTAALPNTVDGVRLEEGSNNNTIGGTTGNLISGNAAVGVNITGTGTTGNTVAANFIGLNAAGTTAIANGDCGVLIQASAATNLIGGDTAAERNIISGNTQDGVQITGLGSDGNTVSANYVGLNSAGTAAIANGNIGVDIVNGAKNNIVGGALAVERNVVSGNARNGVGIGGNTGVTSGDATTGNKVFGNYIGTDAAGTAAVGNGLPGVAIGQSASANEIGGVNTGEGNLISGGGGADGVAIFDAGTTGNLVRGNLIGTDFNGTTALPNNTGVVILDGATSNTVGGTGAARNVISGNTNIGVYLQNGASSNIVKGNYIGVKIDGTSALGNGVGVNIEAGGGALAGSSNNLIGGIAAGEGNVIAFNGTGVFLPANTNASTGNAIRGNSIHDNTNLGINLGGGTEDAAGVTANDAGDADTGSNNLQNYPVLTNVASVGGNTTFTGTLDGPAGTYALDFYRNTANDREGKTYITSNNFVKAAGSQTFTVSAPGTFTGEFVTATATIGGNTSEFSATRVVTAVAGPTISAISPTSGPRGTIVTITGTGFTGTTAVAFNGAATTVFTVNSATQITATVPAGATTGTVAVTANGVTATSAQTFTVTASSYVVTNTTDGGSGSLRDAITFANSNAGTDTITFNIPGAGVKTIAPVTALPDIAQPAVINGYSQPGSSVNTLAVGNDAVLRIEISGASAGPNGALRITGGGTVIRGLAVNGFVNAAGIAIRNGSGSSVTGCFLGTNPAGTASVQNFSGLSITDSTLNLIGGTPAAERNVISGNRISGISISGAVAVGNNTIVNNYVGTNAAGDAALGNNRGIEISGVTGNTIGGTSAALRNVISGNASGVVIFTSSNKVQGNYIGTNAAGTAAVPNTGNGLFTQSTRSNQIGGLTATPGTAPGNVISGNGGEGIDSNGNVAGGNTYQGNIIGLNAAGTAKVPNVGTGLNVRNTGGGNTVGGTDPQARNVISGNGQYGISLDNDNNVIQGNTIGAARNGTTALGNARDGILINSDNNNAIGGIGAGNIIAFNGGNGVAVNFFATGTQNAIRGNSIFANTKLGIDLGNDGVTANDAGDADTGANTLQNFPVIASATAAAGKTTIAGTLNSTAGTFALDFYRNTVNDGEGKIYIGSTTLVKGAGVAPFSYDATGVLTGQFITATATTSNNTSEFSVAKTAVGALPPTAPVISAISPVSGPHGTLVTVTGTGFTGATSVTFNGTATTAFTVNSATQITATVPAAALSGKVSVTTAGGTGTSAQTFTVIASGYVVTNLNDSGPGSLREAIVYVNNHVGPDTVSFKIPGSAAKVIAPATNLPPLTDKATTIDGATQPGFASKPVIAIVPVPVPAGATALTVSGANNTIKSVCLNAAINLRISGAGASGNTVQGNYIGVDAAGTAAAGASYAVILEAGAKNNLIGGTTAVARNVIAGGPTGTGVLIQGSATSGNRVTGNYIGTDFTGKLKTRTGIGVNIVGGASNNTIGGTVAGAPNIIGGSDLSGVVIGDAGTTGNTVLGNLIGIGSDGGDVGNASNGVLVNANANGNTIGGVQAGAANRIANNGLDGVKVLASGITVRGNSIYANNNLGINLGNDNITANDAGDADAGPNALQNFPALTQVKATTASVTLRATLNSTPGAKFIIDLYSTPAGGAGVHREGKTLRGSSLPLTANATGVATQDFAVPIAFVGDFFTATATNTATGNTSEFGPSLTAGQGLSVNVLPAKFSEGAGANAATAIITRSGPTTALLNVTLSSSDTGEATVASSQFLVGQSTIRVPVAAIDDSVLDGPQTVTISASATGYAPASADVSVLDNDQYAVILSRTSGLVTTETGGTATFAARLQSRPAADVSFTLASSDTTEGTVAPVKLTFTSANFATAQTVTVTGVDDAEIDGNVAYKILTGNLVSADFNYNALVVPDIDATNTDNDAAGIIVSPRTGLETDESGKTATFQVSLAAKPAAVVTIELNSNDTGEGIVAPSGLPLKLTFTPVNFAVPQTVTVTGVNDTDVDGPKPYKVVLEDADSTDTNYDGVAGGEVSLTNLDNDSAGTSGILAWGYNEFGQLGDGSTSHRLSPVPAAFGGATALSAGGGHTLTQQGAAAILAAGNNIDGQLGDGTNTARSNPVIVNGVSGVTAIAAGWYHSLALRTDGTVWAWGNNTSGQVGDGTFTDRSTAVQVKGLTDVKAIAAGVYHSVAIKNDGTVWAWGNNFYGQLGNGTDTDSALPVQARGIAGATAVSAGGAHTLVLAGGNVLAMGWNDDGQLGDGTLTARKLPVQVPGLSGVTAIGAGYAHSIALVGGSVRTWGDNAFGQLGIGGGTDSSSPVTAAGLTGVTAIAAGGAHNLALRSDGTVYAWGNNAYGSIGDGTTANRLSPHQVPSLTGVTAISAGYAHSLAIGVLGRVVRSVPAEALASGALLSSASASAGNGTVSLTFTGGLDRASASMAANYSVSAQGEDLALEDAAYSGLGTVTLRVEGLKAGTSVIVKWHGLRDAKGRAIAAGEATVKVK